MALDKLVTINAQVKSGGVAVKILKKLTPISISVSHLMNLTETIGEELAQARDRQAAEHVAKRLEPQVKESPQVVAVGTDGGRLFTRAEGAGRGVHEGAWKETKVACLLTLSSNTSEVDPHPELPGCFADEGGVGKLVREIKSIRGEAGDRAADNATELDAKACGREGKDEDESLLKALILPAQTAGDARNNDASADTESLTSALTNGPATPTNASRKQPDWRPKRRVRTCVSSLCNSDEFGPLVAAEARRRDFFSAARKAFLGDGLKWNWTLQQRWFADFEPILDFVHPTTYVYEVSRVVAADGAAAWRLCQRWLQACWLGQVASVLEELRAWQSLHPTPPDEALPDHDARVIVAKAVTYLSNNASRMNYPKYRRLGLPVTSSLVESLIKEFNYRVKGSEKAWNRSRGGEWILQVRNAVLCDDADRLSDFILTRPGSAYYRPSTTQRARDEHAIVA